MTQLNVWRLRSASTETVQDAGLTILRVRGGKKNKMTQFRDLFS